MKREFRFVKAELRTEAADGKRFISGYAAKFNQMSSDLGFFREVIRPGAFTRTLKSADVRMLINHDPNLILGRNKSGTLSLSEDETGLKFRCELPDTTYAKDLRESISRGDISQCSFGFTVNRQAWIDDKEEEDGLVRELLDVDLFDTSAVTFPAYPDTEVQNTRSFPDGLPADIQEHLPADDPARLAIDLELAKARTRMLEISLTL